MKNVFYKSTKRVITQELLNSVGLGKAKKKPSLKKHFLGSRKGFSVFDVEKTIVAYTKALSLVNFFDKLGLKILFLGSPLFLEGSVQGLLANSKHIFLPGKSWKPGTFSNRKHFPDLIISFKQGGGFSSKECLNKNIPLVSFVGETNNLILADFPILVNLKSVGAAKMFFNLIKQLALRNNNFTKH